MASGEGVRAAAPAEPREPSPIDRAFLTNDPDAGQLILVRHGQQQWPDHHTSTVGDWVDPPLSDLGGQQAVAVGRYLAGEPISTVYSSKLKRAYATGAAIAETSGVDLETVDELEEIHLYGQLPADVRPVDVLGERTVAGARERFVQTRSWDSYPASESSLNFRRRVGVAMEGIIAAHPGETVVVACHGGVINAYVGTILGVSFDMFFRPAHASVSRVRFKHGTRAVETLNEHAFLHAADLLST